MNESHCTDTLMSSTSSSAYSELPEDSVYDFRLKDDNFKFKFKGRSGEEDGVKFRSRPSIEEVMRINHVSNYNMDVLQKSKLKQAVKDMHIH